MYKINNLKFSSFAELVKWAEEVHGLIQLIPPTYEHEKQADCLEIEARINKDIETLLELAAKR